MIVDNIALWGIFLLAVAPLLALDLGVFRRGAREVSTREAWISSAVWVGVALLFGVGVYWFKGADAGVEYLTGYLIEKSLSIDNVFLFAILFSFLQVPSQYRHRVLFWGVLCAIVMRVVLVAVGASLVHQFHWILYIFGAFLLFTGVQMFRHRNEETDLSENKLLKWLRKRLPLTEGYEGEKFFVRRNGALMVTPLFLALVMVEFTDLVFAVDSIPAIFAVTTDPFIVITSNIFAILGLRSLYFLIADLMDRFTYLKVGLSAILVFVGAKMLLPFKVPALLSLAVIVGILALTVAASLWKSRRGVVPSVVKGGADGADDTAKQAVPRRHVA
jgi:tellurite resistance protein TerC